MKEFGWLSVRQLMVYHSLIQVQKTIQHRHDSANQTTIKEFKCSVCAITFDLKFDLMRHRKQEHPKHISVCTKSRNGLCHFGNRKCWFKAEDEKSEIEVNFNENPKNYH